MNFSRALYLFAFILTLAGCPKKDVSPSSDVQRAETASNARTQPTEQASADEQAKPATSTNPQQSPATQGEPMSKPVFVLLQTSKGKIKLELATQKAPKTVANFLAYVQSGHYNGTVFHRVIDNFMIQGGGYTAAFQQKPTQPPVQNEATNGLTNDRGTVAMARTQDPHSATAQFFINVKDNTFLNFREQSVQGWGYTVFGKVVEGMDVVDQIKSTPTGGKGPFPKDVPLEDVVITTASVVE